MKDLVALALRAVCARATIVLVAMVLYFEWQHLRNDLLHLLNPVLHLMVIWRMITTPI